MDFLFYRQKNAWKKTVTGNLIIYFVQQRGAPGKKLQKSAADITCNFYLAENHIKVKRQRTVLILFPVFFIS